MAFHPMKPETIERKRREHLQARHAGRQELLRRAQEAARRDGPDSLSAELLADLVAHFAAEPLVAL